MRRQCPELAAGQRQEHMTMAAEPPESPVTEAIRRPVCLAHPRARAVAVAGRAEQDNLHAARFAFGTDTTRAESAIGRREGIDSWLRSVISLG